MRQAHDFLSQFRNAKTNAERQAVAGAYQHYFDSLTALDQQQARQIMQPLRADIQESLDELDHLSREAERILAARFV